MILFLWSHSSCFLPCCARFDTNVGYAVKFGDKERFGKEQIAVKEPYLVTNMPVY